MRAAWRLRPGSAGIVKWVEEQARTLPAGTPEFDHYMPSAHLIGFGPEFKLADEAGAMDRLEPLFTDLNVLLPSK